MSIVNIDDNRPHICCNAECKQCKYKWVAVAPAKASILECPSCHEYTCVFFMNKYSKEMAENAGMIQSLDGHCPECGCDYYGNENLIGDGYRCCAECQQDWWADVKYTHSVLRRELT